MINPTTHAISEFATPTAGSAPYAITAGPDGNLWFTEIFGGGGGNIGEINPTTHAITEYPLPSGGDPQGITAGPDGNIWFTELTGNKVGMINPTTHAIAEFPVPTANAYPRGIAVGPDGNLWFAEDQASQVGMINPTTHAITEFPIRCAAQLDHGRPRRQPLVHRAHRGEIGEHQPGDTRRHLVPHPLHQFLSRRNYGGPRRQRLVRRSRDQLDRGRLPGHDQPGGDPAAAQPALPPAAPSA